MKKMLIMAMAVFALVACKKSSDTGLPKADAKALEVTTSGAVDMLGDSPKQVDAALTDAGYKKIKNGFNPFEYLAPARVVKKATAAKADSDEEVCYGYGIPDDWDKMTEKQIIAWANNVIESGDPVMLVTATFESNFLNAMATIFMIKKTNKANKTYTATSDDLYKKLPSGKNNYAWVGYIGDISRIIKEDVSAMTQYTDHSNFVSKAAKADGVGAMEYGNALNKGWSYATVWANPDASLEKELLEYGLTAPICIGAYSVSQVNYDYFDYDF